MQNTLKLFVHFSCLNEDEANCSPRRRSKVLFVQIVKRKTHIYVCVYTYIYMDGAE
jgi:hypothetical protein